MNNLVRTIGSFLRWRLVPVRYLTMVLNFSWSKVFRSPAPRLVITQKIQSKGFATGSALPDELLATVQDIYQCRAVGVKQKVTGHPFVNLFTVEDICLDNPVLRYALSPEVLDVAADYFGGKPLLDSIQVLYSYPTEGEQRESQYWHLDYGDSKSFHCIIYLNDVLSPTDGPFVCVDKHATHQVGRSIVVRRIPDKKFVSELKNNSINSFLGPAGSTLFVDPSSCYHYGSRCKTPRLAIFLTFSTWFPYVQPVPLVKDNAQSIRNIARLVRPDISEEFWVTLLQVDSTKSSPL